MLVLLYGCTTWTLRKGLEKKLNGNYTRILLALLKKNSLSATIQNSSCMVNLHPVSQTILDLQDMLGTAGKLRTEY